MALPELVVILGGGVTGLSLAMRLSEHDIPVQLFEKNKTVGGLAGTLRQSGYCLDVGPHSFFSEDDDIRNFVLDHFQETLSQQPRIVKLFYEGRYLDYPLTPQAVLFQMGIGNGLKAAVSYIKSRLVRPSGAALNPAKDETVEDWAIKSFGPHLYTTFFKPYTEQFWKIKSSELSAKTIPAHTKMSFLNTCKTLIWNNILKIIHLSLNVSVCPRFILEAVFTKLLKKLPLQLKKTGRKSA